METIFIEFISTFLALIFFCVLLYKLIKTKGITLRDNVVVLLTSSFVLILGSTITSGEKINEKIKTTYSISKEFNSPEDVQDTLINDSILSNYLQEK